MKVLILLMLVFSLSGCFPMMLTGSHVDEDGEVIADYAPVVVDGYVAPGYPYYVGTGYWGPGYYYGWYFGPGFRGSVKYNNVVVNQSNYNNYRYHSNWNRNHGGNYNHGRQSGNFHNQNRNFQHNKGNFHNQNRGNVQHHQNRGSGNVQRHSGATQHRQQPQAKSNPSSGGGRKHK
jgi:hypothetical protein